MTSIDKLAIRGIRSFSPADTQVIEFFKPLTLIVGKNGSGKTTIIECLKMGSTGDLPPNCRSGQAFINDPNVYGTSEVKAQIKLKFTSALGKPAVYQRSFSLTQKAQSRQYKAFEAALQTLDEHNEKACLSYKCADLNKLVPEMMGVSTAVLESVVFVHQEDSCWPLSEDKVLKQKFDDIFAATNYTKALDNIKAYRLEKSKDIRVLAAELETLETKLNTATRLREEQRQAEETRASIREKVSTIGEAIEAAKAKLPGLEAQVARHHKLRIELRDVIQLHNHANEAMNEASSHIESAFGSHLMEDDDELREIESKQSSAGTKLTADHDALANKCRELEREVEHAEGKRDRARGSLEQERAVEVQNRRTEAEAKELIESMDSNYHLGSGGLPAGASPADHAQAALDSLARVLQSRESDLSGAKAERQATANTLGSRVQQMKLEVDHSQEAASNKDREARALTDKQRALQDRADATGAFGDEATITRLRSELQDYKSQAAVAEEDLASSNLVEDIANDKVRKRDLKAKHGSLGEELANIEREGDKLQRLQRHQQAADEKKTKLATAVNERWQKLGEVLDVSSADDVMRMLDMENLNGELARKKYARDEEVSEKERELQHEKAKENRKNQEMYVKQEAMRTLEDAILRDEEDVRSTEPLMLQESYNFEERLRTLEEAHTKAQEALHTGSALLQVMERAKAKAEKDGKCLVCSQHTTPEALTHIKRKHDSLALQHGPGADKMQLQQDDARAAENVRKHKRAAELSHSVKRRKTTEVAAIRLQIDAKRTEAAEIKRVADARAAELDELKARAEKTRSLERDADHLKYVHKEWKDANAEVASIQSGMQSGMHTAMRSREVVISARDEAQDELDKLEKRIEQKGQELDRKRSDLAETKTRSSVRELELNKLQASLEKRREIEAQLDEHKKRVTELHAESNRLRENERPLQQKLAHAEAELRSEEQRLDATVRDLDAAVSTCMRDHTKLADYTRRLAQASSDVRQRELADCEARFADAEKQVAEKRTQLKERHHKKSVLNERLQGQEKLKLQMSANLKFRDLRIKERDLHAQADKLQTELRGIEAVSEAANQEILRCQKVMNQRGLERSRLEGSLSTVEANIRGFEGQLKDKAFKKVDIEHREKLIEHKTVQMVVDDLNKYYKALNAALMRFHETKMEDINKSITELWNKTYKGSDIDGIQIKTEDEGQTADGKRKQSYRVVMRKGDTQLDMRGRCSAGQRVLASLVIRLALAETFCINCGILALDEPTTNLDAANIESLAQAINEIIKSRKQQSNFQLIVITHDEQFVQQIGRSENASHYFHVEKRFLKDGDPPASTITKKAIEQFG